MNGPAVKKVEIMKKVAKITLKILYEIFIVFCILLVSIVVIQKFSDNNRAILGYRIFRVVTGSMEPEYDIGEVVICKEISPENIKMGDDIVYLGKYGDYAGKVIMHSVIKIDKDDNNNLNFHAKGLHSSSMEDPQIKAEQIYGIVKYKSPILSWLYKLATSLYTSFIIIIVLVLNVFISFADTRKTTMKQLKTYELEELEDGEKEYEDELEEVNEEDDEDIESNE